MFLMSLYAIAITVGLCLYWFLHSITTKKLPTYLEGPSENQDSPEDNGSSGLLYLKPHKSPRKVQLKEVHHPNETASIRVMTPDGVTLVQTRQEEKSKGPRRPAPPPPPKQPPKRPPPPPPPLTPTQVAVLIEDLKIRSNAEADLPLPPPPSMEGNEIMNICDEPLPPPPDPQDVDIQPRISLIYPKNSYMSYKSEKKISRQGFDGNYRRSFHTSMDLSTCDSINVFSPSSWEHHDTTVIFQSDCLPPGNRVESNSSQDCDISTLLSENQSPNCPQDQLQSVPTSQNLPLDTKGKSTITDAILNCETSDSHCSFMLDNGRETLIDHNSIPAEIDPNVDLNQNSVKNNRSARIYSQSFNGADINNQINCTSQTTNTTRLHRKYCKTKAELECEQLSLDFIHHAGDVNLKKLLVPDPYYKTMSDYTEGLLLEIKEPQNSPQNQNEYRYMKKIIDEKRTGGSEKFDRNISEEVNDNRNVDEALELNKKKEKLILCIRKKIESLKDEQKLIREEMIQNELLGKDISNQLQALAKPNEMEKYLLHVEEMEKIVNLLLSLSGRLAKAENILKNMQDSNSEEKKLLESKRDKLKDQHEDACRLKESIDKRSNQVSAFLDKYFSESEYANYDRFLKMRTKLIVDIREIDEKISLGEEQLAALSVVVHLWKSANS